MSRDRLAAMRAQQQQQRNVGRQQQQDQDAAYEYSNGYNGSGNGESYGGSYDDGRSNLSPPSYRSRDQDTYRGDNYGENSNTYQYEQQANSGRREYNEDARGTRTRNRPRRQPSQAAYRQEERYQSEIPSPTYREQSNNGRSIYPTHQNDQEWQQGQYSSSRQDPGLQIPAPQTFYGGREDESAYMEKNQSRAALNEEDSTVYDEKYGAERRGYPPTNHRQKSKKGRKEGYDVPLPTLSKYPQRQTMQVARQSTFQGSNPPTPGANVISNAPVVDMVAFFEEVGAVRSAFQDLQNMIQYLDQLHARNLSGNPTEELQHELEQTANNTRKLTNQLRKRIKVLQETTRIRTHGQAEADRQTRKIQISAVRDRFLEIVQNYQSMEMKNRDKAKQRIERQYQIVNPTASPDEVRQVVESGQEVQIFAQALRTSNRVGNAQGVLNEVQNRHEDIKKIEKTLVELFQLFQDMAVMVEEQDEQIQQIEAKADEVSKDMEVGQQEIVKAVVSAKKARKKRKCCFIIAIILLLVIGGVVAYLVVKVIIPKINENKNKDSDSSSAKTTTVTATSSTKSATKTSATTSDSDKRLRVRGWPEAEPTSLEVVEGLSPTITARAYVLRKLVFEG